MSFQSKKLTHPNGGMYHLGVADGQIAKKVLLLSDPRQVPVYAAYLDNAEKVAEHREYVTYTGSFEGIGLSIMSCGFGCMPMAIAVEELKHLGVEEIIKIDCCPAIGTELRPGMLCAASGAVRGEYASREYIDVSYPAVSDMSLMRRLLRSGVEHVGLFRSHDVTSLETPRTEAGRKKLAYWESLGVQVIDGESSAMLVIASVLKLKAASLALISENYSSGESLQVEEAQRKTLFQTAARALCLRYGGSL